MPLRQGSFDFHGAPPASQRAEDDLGTAAHAGPLGETVFGRGPSHFEALEPVAARMISVAVAIIAASLCLTFFSQSHGPSKLAYTANLYLYMSHTTTHLTSRGLLQ